MAPAQTDTVLALDVGSRRIGVAIASLISKLPSPLDTLPRDGHILQSISKLIDDNSAVAVVVGLPRGLSGQETAQTVLVRKFAKELAKLVKVPLYLQDEAVTSKQAERELAERGVRYNKGAIDALSAVYILDDWLAEHQEF